VENSGGRPASPVRQAQPNKIVYLIGAGATQAEISHLGAAQINLSMQDNALGDGIATRILQQLPGELASSFLSEDGIDIEKLISLLAASGHQEHETIAAELRKLYCNEICKSLSEAGVLTSPSLAIGLLALHAVDALKPREHLAGIITTNHDGLFQLAASKVHGAVNIGIPFGSVALRSDDTQPPILQLHGSFTWEFGIPLQVEPLIDGSSHSPSALWLPPAILKEHKLYPFNKLAGLAYELLSRQCDILRVIGASLTQNDWNILSLLFNTQRHREARHEKAFRIELVMPRDNARTILRECSYLRYLTSIERLEEGDFTPYSEEAAEGDSMDVRNPMLYWLAEKIDFHRRRGELGAEPLRPELATVIGEPS
jgi:hypothetical protein